MEYIFKTDNTIRYQFPTHINDLVMDRAEASFSEVFIVIVEPDKAPPLHRHNDTEQIFYILKGNGRLIIRTEEEQQEFEVSPGDVVRIPVNTLHSIQSDQDENLEYLAIDCFGNNRNQDEPTWEDHVKVLCKNQKWDFEEVKSASQNELKP